MGIGNVAAGGDVGMSRTGNGVGVVMEEERIERLTDAKKRQGADAKEHPLEKVNKSSKASRNKNDMKKVE